MSHTDRISADRSGRGQWTLVQRLLGLAWCYRGRCALVVLQQISLVGLMLLGLGFTGLGIDVVRHAVDPASAFPRWPLGIAPPADWSALQASAMIAGAIVIVAGAHAALKWRASITGARLVNDIVVKLRADVYEKLQSLSFGFYDSRTSGSIINRVTGDVQSVRMFVDGAVVQGLVVCLSLAVYIAYMLQVHVGLTLACLATTPLLWACSAWFARRVRRMYLENGNLADDLVLVLSENVQGVQAVKGFAREREEIARFAAANDRVRASKRAIFWQVSIYQPAMGLLTQLNLVVLLAFGGWLVVQGRIRLGEGLFVFANLLQQFGTQVGQIANIANSIQQSLTGAQRVFEVLDANVEIASPLRPAAPPKSAGRVAFERVSFSYRPGASVLSDISFTARPGEIVAVTGPVGAGKSALLSLIPRLYDVAAGSVIVDGRDVRDWPLEALRQRIGMVFQESFLFCNTIAANIAFGRPGASMDQIRRAAELAAIDRDIASWPKGYDTIVGEHGVNLSGGQRQRLALARALLLEPAILILDDATSAVDTETEAEILTALERAAEGRTTFVAAHRASTIARADVRLALEAGRLVKIEQPSPIRSTPERLRPVGRLYAADAG